MKKFIIALLLVTSLGLSSLPQSAQAATRAELLQQIETLTKLISLLQMQLKLKKQSGNSVSDTSVSMSTQTGDTYLDLIATVKVSMPAEKSFSGNAILFYGDNSAEIVKRTGSGVFSGTYQHSYSKPGDYIVKLVFSDVKNVDSEIEVMKDSNHPKNTVLKSVNVSINKDDMQLYLKNISNPTTNVFRDGAITATPRDRIGVGWKNTGLKDCELKDVDDDLDEQFYYKGSSEIETGVAVHMPGDDVPSNEYEVTVECQLDGKTVSDSVKIKYNNPYYKYSTIDWSKQLQGVLREKPDVKGYLSIQQVNSTAMQLSGSITPHDDCVGTENMEVILDYGNGSSKPYTLEECEMVFFKEAVLYTPSQIPVYPTLKLKWEDWDNNVWQYSDLSRYMLNLTNPLSPTITNLGINGEKG